jgi:benzoyl-CoA reductase/2-hydroxyglutaryl-CoA dehydratase subunit BcrC/BadD/HgdB
VFANRKSIEGNRGKGVITVAMTGCPYGGLVQKTERDYFQRLGVPMVTLETNVHREPPGEEQITRIKTFFEMLDLAR